MKQDSNTQHQKRHTPHPGRDGLQHMYVDNLSIYQHTLSTQNTIDKVWTMQQYSAKEANNLYSVKTSSIYYILLPDGILIPFALKSCTRLHSWMQWNIVLPAGHGVINIRLMRTIEPMNIRIGVL